MQRRRRRGHRESSGADVDTGKTGGTGVGTAMALHRYKKTWSLTTKMSLRNRSFQKAPTPPCPWAPFPPIRTFLNIPHLPGLSRPHSHQGPTGLHLSPCILGECLELPKHNTKSYDLVDGLLVFRPDIPLDHEHNRIVTYLATKAKRCVVSLRRLRQGLRRRCAASPAKGSVAVRIACHS